MFIWLCQSSNPLHEWGLLSVLLRKQVTDWSSDMNILQRLYQVSTRDPGSTFSQKTAGKHVAL